MEYENNLILTRKASAWHNTDHGGGSPCLHTERQRAVEELLWKEKQQGRERASLLALSLATSSPRGPDGPPSPSLPSPESLHPLVAKQTAARKETIERTSAGGSHITPRTTTPYHVRARSRVARRRPPRARPTFPLSHPRLPPTDAVHTCARHLLTPFYTLWYAWRESQDMLKSTRSTLETNGARTFGKSSTS